MSENNFQVAERFGWIISNNGFVYPKMSSEFSAALEVKKNTPFGEISLCPLNTTRKYSFCKNPDENLKDLASFVASMET